MNINNGIITTQRHDNSYSPMENLQVNQNQSRHLIVNYGYKNNNKDNF